MNIEISEAPITAVVELALIPIAFKVDCVLDVAGQDDGFGGVVLSERRLDVPYVKDYDAITGEGPTEWAKRFDISNWGLLRAHSNGSLVGGAVVAFNSAGVIMLEGREDLAALWDIRVLPEVRRQGVGARLFHAAEVWATARGCRQLKVETQNINVAACRFYAQQGCVLGGIQRLAYPELPDEIQLLWYKDLPTPDRQTV
jgi:GNAT superfamily N-acetyltransferase